MNQSALKRLAALCSLLAAAGGCEDQETATKQKTYRISGDAIPFDKGPDGRISGAKISVLERPDLTMTTGTDGHFEFTGLAAGSEATLVLEHPDYHLIQTGTFTVDADIERVTFQAVTHGIYKALSLVVGITPDEASSCQMVTTITRIGKSIYDPGAHGEADVTVTLAPALSAEHGPIYFDSSVVPDKTLTRSSDDGGVLYVQVPPGNYTWTATKAGATFAPVKMKCRPGVLVNASPPKGLQRLQ